MNFLECSTVLGMLLGIGFALDVSLDDIWMQFKETHNKVYQTSKQDLFRRQVWEDNVDKVFQHNLKYDLGQSTFTMGINEYSDLTFEEYKKYLLGARPEMSTVGKGGRLVYEAEKGHVGSLPDSVDWRDKGYVTPIKNQGQCGSCWAFSSTGALEGQHFKKYGQLVSLSEQNLVDCCKTNAGCNGGWMDNSFKYVQSNAGLDTEAYYPYQSHETGSCSYNSDPADVGTDCTGLVDISKGREDVLQAAVANIGPIAVAIDAAHSSFQQYSSGIYFEADCSRNNTDHAVLAVGYGSQNEYDYWIVKNSWGTSWGDNGYIKMGRNMKNMCAIATFASYPTV